MIDEVFIAAKKSMKKIKMAIISKMMENSLLDRILCLMLPFVFYSSAYGINIGGISSSDERFLRN